MNSGLGYVPEALPKIQEHRKIFVRVRQTRLFLEPLRC